MTLEHFEKLSAEEKNKWLLQAEKLAERLDNFTKVQLYRVNNFYVETRTSMLGRFKRKIKTYSNSRLPINYVTTINQLS